MEPGPTASKKETITPSSTIPYLKAIQISARSEPISPSYDPNEFVHFYNKKSHKKIMIFIKNRCAQVMTNLIAPFMQELIVLKYFVLRIFVFRLGVKISPFFAVLKKRRLLIKKML